MRLPLPETAAAFGSEAYADAINGPVEPSIARVLLEKLRNIRVDQVVEHHADTHRRISETCNRSSVPERIVGIGPTGDYAHRSPCRRGSAASSQDAKKPSASR